MRRLYLGVGWVLVVGLVALYGVADAAAPVVSNVHAEQRSGTTGSGVIVDITYDVEDVDSDSVRVTIEVSKDGGQTFAVPARTFTGDIRWVSVGTGKAVAWHAGVDVPGEHWDTCQVKVIAEESPWSALVTSVKVGMLYTADASNTSTRYGAELAMSQINQEGGVLGFPLKLLIRDDEDSPGRSAQLAEELITQENVVALIGPNYSRIALQVSPVAQQYGVPMVATTATNPEVTAAGDMVFLGAFPDMFQGEVTARFARESLGAQTAALLIQTGDPYVEGLGLFFEMHFARLGGTIVARETYVGGDTDFTAPLTAIAALAPDVIFMPGFAPEVPLAVQQARTIPQQGASGITATFLGGDGWEDPNVLVMGGVAVEESYFSTLFSPDTQDETAGDFVGSYRLMFGMIPDGAAAMGYDAVRLVAAAIRRAGSLDKASIRDQLAATRGYKGATSVLSYSESRHPRKGAVIMQIKDGRFQLYQEVEP